MSINELTELVIGCAYSVHNTLGAGFLEKVYENAMVLELRAAGLNVQAQSPIAVRYRDEVVGDFYADLLVEGVLIIELKVAASIGVEHEAQLVSYLAATGIDNGLLINFGRSVEVRRKYRQYQRRG